MILFWIFHYRVDNLYLLIQMACPSIRIKVLSLILILIQHNFFSSITILLGLFQKKRSNPQTNSIANFKRFFLFLLGFLAWRLPWSIGPETSPFLGSIGWINQPNPILITLLIWMLFDSFSMTWKVFEQLEPIIGNLVFFDILLDEISQFGFGKKKTQRSNVGFVSTIFLSNIGGQRSF